MNDYIYYPWPEYQDPEGDTVIVKVLTQQGDFLESWNFISVDSQGMWV